LAACVEFGEGEVSRIFFLLLVFASVPLWLFVFVACPSYHAVLISVGFLLIFCIVMLIS
jgi:hypothetical protein